MCYLAATDMNEYPDDGILLTYGGEVKVPPQGSSPYVLSQKEMFSKLELLLCQATDFPH